MTTRDHAPFGAPCWIDLMSADTEVTVPFYCGLFGWEAEAPNEEFGGYRNFTRNGSRIAGCMRAEHSAQGPGVWSVYLAVEDAVKTLEAAAANGGQVVAPAMPVGDLGTMGLIAAPDGSGIGIWQPGTHPGFVVLGEPGAPSWFELHTSRYDEALDFYRDTFGWDTTPMSDTPEFRYTTVGDSERPVAGIMDSSAWGAGAPAGWSVYFWVADTDASLRTVTDLGGSVVAAAEDTPYGRLATAADPTGVQFKLMAANDQMPAR